MRHSDLTSFASLLDRTEVEQSYQDVLESSPRLIPQEFVQNHGIHFGLIFRKLKLAENHVTDFFFLSKSSADWNAVFIELELPSSRYFKEGTESFHPDFHKGLEQINSWRAWLSKASNLKHLMEQTLDPIWVPSWMRANPVFPKFVLVTGRRKELCTDNLRRSLVTSQEKEDFKILSYDSLLDGYRTNEEVYVAVKTNSRIRVLGDEYRRPVDFDWIEPDRYELSAELVAQIRNAMAGDDKRLFDQIGQARYEDQLSRATLARA